MLTNLPRLVFLTGASFLLDVSHALLEVGAPTLTVGKKRLLLRFMQLGYLVLIGINIKCFHICSLQVEGAHLHFAWDPIEYKPQVQRWEEQHERAQV